MIPAAVGGPVETYLHELARACHGRVAAVYAVGGLALDDFSPRHSNIDLVVVSDPLLDSAVLAGLRRAERSLERVGRPAGIWHTSWQVIAEGPVDPAPAESRSTLDTPMTRELLRNDAVALTGPDWPVVAYDDEAFRRWCRRRLAEVAAGAGGLMIMRSGVADRVLEAARLAQGALTGRVLSKSEAGESSTRLVPAHFRRILTDAAGYRQGARTSMYWGPFERKYDARELIRHLVDAVGPPGP